MNDVQTVQKRLKGLMIKRPGFTVALCGPAGIGKTFAVQKLLRETPCRNLSIHARTHPSDLARVLPRPKPQPWAERMLERIAAGEFVETKGLIDLIGSMLSGLAPFVLHLEDVHELEAEKLEFVEELARVVQRLKGVALIVTSRNTPPEPFEQVPIEGLSSVDVTDLLEREVGTTLPVDALEWIQSRAAGNPLFTLEFFRFLVQRGAVWSDGHQWHWREPPDKTMPVTIETLIEHSLAPVLQHPNFAAVLVSGSMIPIELPSEATAGLWESMAQMTPAVWHETVQELQAQGWLRHHSFTHLLIPEVIRQGLSVSLRQQFARRAIAALETQYPEQAIAFLEDASLEPGAALVLLEHAWTRMDARGNKLLAARLMVRAVRYAQGAGAVGLALNAATRLCDLDSFTALEMLELALRLEPNNETVMLLRARTLVYTATFAQAEQAFEQLPLEVRVSQPGMDTWFEMICHADKKRLVHYWDEHPEMRHRIELIAPRIVAHIDQIQTEQAIALAQTTLARPDLTDAWQRAKLLNSLGNIYRSSHQFEQADTLFTQTIELIEREVGGRQVHSVYYNRALTRQSLGRFAEARADLQVTIRFARNVRDTSNLSMALSTLAELETGAGRYECAEDLLRQARALLEPLELHRFHVDLENACADLYQIWPGQAYSGILALKHARNALHLARTLESTAAILTALSRAGQAEAQFGQIERAQAIASELDEMYDTEMGIPYHEASWIRALILERQGQQRAALEQYRLAREACVQVKRAVLESILDLELARMTQDVPLANSTLARFETRQMHHYSNRIRQFFPQLSVQTKTADTASNSSTLRLEVLGPMQTVRDQTGEAVRGRKRQTLLALLLEARIAGRNEIHQLELIDTLYPDEPEDQALSSLKQAVRGVRTSLGGDAIQTTGNGYTLGSVTSDAETFLTTGEITLWRGAYLDGLGRIWDDDSIRENLHFALLCGAQRILESDPEAALRAGRILMAYDAYNLEHLALCVRALQLRNNHKSLNRLYQEARAQLLEVAEEIPERWQDFLKAHTVLVNAN